MAELVKETATLHRVLSRYLHSSTLELVMMQVLSAINSRLAEEFSRIDLRTEASKVRLLADATYLRSKLAELKGLERPTPGEVRPFFSLSMLSPDFTHVDPQELENLIRAKVTYESALAKSKRAIEPVFDLAAESAQAVSSPAEVEVPLETVQKTLAPEQVADSPKVVAEEFAAAVPQAVDTVAPEPVAPEPALSPEAPPVSNAVPSIPVSSPSAAPLPLISTNVSSAPTPGLATG